MNLNMLQFLQNNSEQFSWMRGVGALWLIGILAMWCYCSFVAGCLQVIPESVIFIAGMVLTGKVVENGLRKSQRIHVMIKSWIERKLRKFFRPPWEAYVDTGNSLERKARIREMLEKEKILKELAEADRESNIRLNRDEELEKIRLIRG